MRYEDVIGQFANRQPGSPQMPKVAGGSPVPSRPSAPAPPGLNAAMPGRKPDNPPPMEAGGGIPTPPKMNTEQQATNDAQQKNVDQARPVMMLNRLPKPGEMAGLPPGLQVRTPYGDLDEEGNLVKSPEYEQKQKEAIVRARQRFGPHPWNGMAGAPEPNVELGRSYFNPFTNSFGRAE